MTPQFKFGDRVARKNETPDYDKAFIVISAKDNGEICVFSSISKLPFDVQAKDYQLVPHPDPVRLDWLADRDNHIGNVQLPAECVACNLHSLRDAIDMAMKLPEPPKAA